MRLNQAVIIGEQNTTAEVLSLVQTFFYNFDKCSLEKGILVVSILSSQVQL